MCPPREHGGDKSRRPQRIARFGANNPCLFAHGAPAFASRMAEEIDDSSGKSRCQLAGADECLCSNGPRACALRYGRTLARTRLRLRRELDEVGEKQWPKRGSNG